MAQELGPSGGLFAAIGGWVVALLIALFTFIAQWRKGGVDETAVVLGKWKELVEAHQTQLASLKDEIVELRARVADLEDSNEQLEKTAKKLAKDVEERDARIAKLERDLEGEKRNLQQQANSFAEQLKRLGHNNPPEIGK